MQALERRLDQSRRPASEPVSATKGVSDAHSGTGTGTGTQTNLASAVTRHQGFGLPQ
jgi:hypothetical protein